MENSEPKKPLKLGRKFFSEESSGTIGTKGYRLDWKGMVAAYEKQDALKKTLDKATNSSLDHDQRVREATQKLGKAKSPADQARWKKALNKEENFDVEDQQALIDQAKANLEGYNSRRGAKAPRYATIVHEASHWALGTNDESVELPNLSARTMYGEMLCLKLAQTNPEKARTNADSWRFFIETYGP